MKNPTHTKSSKRLVIILLLLFLVLKIGGEIEWSWLWVVAPFWVWFLFGRLRGAVVESRKQDEKENKDDYGCGS